MLVLTGYGLGLVLAAQVGPVTLLIARSVLRGGARSRSGSRWRSPSRRSTSATRSSASPVSGGS